VRPGVTKAKKSSVCTFRPISDNSTNSARFRIRSAFLKKKLKRSPTPAKRLAGSVPARKHPAARLACQAGSALGPAAAQNISTRLGGHAFAKSMVPGSFEPAGLKWSFHRCRSFSLLRVGDADSAETTPDA
jgi:hypothetical protein